MCYGYSYLTCFKILPFAVMQLVARVYLRQLNYLLHLALPFIFVAGNLTHFKIGM